jgi:hypothetical protein
MLIKKIPENSKDSFYIGDLVDINGSFIKRLCDIKGVNKETYAIMGFESDGSQIKYYTAGDKTEGLNVYLANSLDTFNIQSKEVI